MKAKVQELLCTLATTVLGLYNEVHYPANFELRTLLPAGAQSMELLLHTSAPSQNLLINFTSAEFWRQIRLEDLED
ncbi:hypothetical protein BN1708_006015 [Verticillium longisporum]|uniref:Uncharacterized protein n=1 Tax=Verticillium longisporum TaxID=100787 RepID=A0A0G4MFR8_VERLO|nr:hypothetical protein BN1708_006015 [Verticillium longisporum]